MEQILTIVVPTLNAAASLPRTLASIAPATIVVVDGGSTDATRRVAAAAGAHVLQTNPSRGGQCAAGAAAASGAWLLFLHADTSLAAGWQEAVERFRTDPSNAERAAYFRFSLDDATPSARRLERWVAWRCHRLALPYGDQGLLISRALYTAIGGHRPLPLMEDVDLVRRLGRARLVALPVDAVTSAERWRRDGWWRRSARNLGCLALYRAGVPPRWLLPLYGRRPGA